MKKINCAYARFAAWEGQEPVYECHNQKAGDYLKKARDKTCASCRARVQLDPYEPPIINRQQEDKQITIEEYLRNATA